MSVDLSELVENMPNLEWLDDGACEDMDILDFFVEAGHTISVETLNVCRGCPVRVDCLTHAYERRIFGGYFGGVSPGQRKEMTFEEALAFIANDPVRTEVEDPARRRKSRSRRVAA